MDFRGLIYSLLNQNEQACGAYFAVYQKILPKSIKIISHKIQQNVFHQKAKDNNRQLSDTWFFTNADSRYLDREETKDWLGKHWLHQAWFFYIQEVAASLAAPTLTWSFNQANDAPLLFLDMCAAPGGKSIQIADRLLANNRWWLVVCNEINTSRISALDHNIRRTWSYNTCTTSYSGEFFWENMEEKFDGVLVDAPCSGEGTGFKSDAGTKRRREETIHNIARTQKKLLESAILACKPWGYVVYATCTINPRENEFVVQHALEVFWENISLENVPIHNKSTGISHRENKVILSKENTHKVARFRPHIHNTGWFFIAKFHKKNSTLSGEKTPKKQQLQNSNLDTGSALQTQISHILKDSFGITTNSDNHLFVATDSQVYLTTPEYKNIHWLLFTQKIGVPIFKKDKNTLLPLHWLGVTLGDLATKNTISLSDHNLQKYADGFDIETSYISSTANKFVIITHQTHGVSVGKIVHNTIKNKFLR